MEVNHQHDLTSVVIGGGQTHSFTMSDDAAFYHNFSANLYQYPAVAAIREPITNAWDSHINKGNTDDAIVIIKDSQSIHIRDFGNGISKEDFYEIYGVFGGSTKKQSDEETGGFGLGCKAPFAVVENFQVTSHNNGLKTIYSLARTSNHGGKPGITELITVPTSESGLLVSIPRDKFNHFDDVINMICSTGQINAYFINNLDDKPLDTYEDIFNHILDHNIELIKPIETKGNKYYAFDYRQGSKTNLDSSDFLIKYGAMLYPITFSSLRSTNHKKAESVISNIRKIISDNSKTNIKLVIEVEPNTLTIMPSREGLVFNDYTTNNLIKQLNIALNDIQPLFKKAREDVHYFVSRLLFKQTINSDDYINHEADCLVIKLIGLKYLTNFRNNLYQNVFDNPFSCYQYNQMNPKGSRGIFDDTELFHDNASKKIRYFTKDFITKKVLKNIHKLKSTGLDILFLYHDSGNTCKVQSIDSALKDASIRENYISNSKNVLRNQLVNILPLLVKKVVIAHRNPNKEDSDNLKSLHLSDSKESYFVKVSRKKGEKEKTIKLLQSIGFSIIDITHNQAISPRLSKSNRKETIRNSVNRSSYFNDKRGYYCTSNFVKSNEHPNKCTISNGEKFLNKNPKYVIYTRADESLGQRHLYSCDVLTIMEDTKNHKGAFAVSLTQYQSLRWDHNVPTISEYALTYILENYLNKKSFVNNFIMENYETVLHKLLGISSYNFKDARLTTVLNNEELRKLYKLPVKSVNENTPQWVTNMIVGLLSETEHSYNLNKFSEIISYKDFYDIFKDSTHYKKMAASYKNIHEDKGMLEYLGYDIFNSYFNKKFPKETLAIHKLIVKTFNQEVNS